MTRWRTGIPRSILLAGASGLTGQRTLDALLEAPEVSRVVAVSRRALGREHSRLANRIVKFESIEAQLKGVTCDAALCCLGTTLRQAGSQERFRAVDVDAVLAYARVAKAANARRFVVISSVGADPASRNFYLRTKGEMEEALETLGSSPSTSCSPRSCSAGAPKMRPLELLGVVLMPLVSPLLAASTRTTAASPRVP